MNARGKIFTIFSLFVILSMVFGSALAEDGLLFRRNISKTPALETAKADIFMMDFYVPAQSSSGGCTGLVMVENNYYLADGPSGRLYEPCLRQTVDLSVYRRAVDAHRRMWKNRRLLVDGGIIFGAMDAFVGVSLDDGTTCKTTNVSRSADLSSFTLRTARRTPATCTSSCTRCSRQYLHGAGSPSTVKVAPRCIR